MSIPSDGGRRGVWRSRWAAIGAAVAVTLGGGGLFVVNAASSTPSSFVAIDPVRILDSRDGNDVGLAGPFVSAAGLDLIVTGSIPTTTGTKVVVPTGATAVSMNVTVVGPTANGFLSVRPADATGLASVSSLNFDAGDTVPNAVTVQLPTSGPDAGRIEITYNAYNIIGPTTDVLIDVVGYYTEPGFVSAKEDTFYYVPGSLLEIHYDDGPATVYFDNSSDAIVRKTGSPGDMQVLIPVPLPAELGGDWAKLVNVRVSYMVKNVNSYIADTWLTKSSNTGSHVDVAHSPTDQKSTTYTSYVVDCSNPGCQLAWVPNGNYVTVGLMLHYAGTGINHDITIGGVLLRVSYDG